MRMQDSLKIVHFFFRNFPQFPRTPAPVRDPPPPQFPQDQFAPQQSNVNNVPIQQREPPRQEPREPPRQPPPPPPRPQQNQLQAIFGPQQQQPQPSQQQNPFSQGPFTAFNNFPRVEESFNNPPPQQQQGRAPGLGFEAVRNTVVHDSSSQSSSFFSFQRPEFQRQQQAAQPTRFPVAERPSPVQQGSTFFQGFPALGSFVDPRNSAPGQRAQRALPEGASVPLAEEVNRQLDQPTYRFPDAEFGGFVPMKRKY